MNRKLASVQEISEIHPIKNAENIEVVKVLGWYVVVQKNSNFKVGDKIVYIEIDSILPEKEEFEFLRRDHFRIRTIKLRGQVSQGIVFPLSILPLGNYLVGQDVTTELDIKKYDPPIPTCLNGVMKGPFPSFIRRTKETRVQVSQSILTKYKTIPCYVSEKVDGTSVTFYLKDGEFGVCSMGMELVESDDNAYWRAAHALDLKARLKRGYHDICLQGELYGSGIQGNKYRLPDGQQNVAFFNAFNIQDFNYYSYNHFTSLIKSLNYSGKTNTLQTVPILQGYFELTDNIDELVEMSKGKSILNPAINREGIVIRPLQEINDISFGRVSFKVINPDFSLKYGE